MTPKIYRACCLLTSLLLLSFGCESSDTQKAQPAQPFAQKEAADSPLKQTSNIEAFTQLRLRTQGTPIEEAKMILVLLHGYGAQGTDLMRLGSSLR